MSATQTPSRDQNSDSHRDDFLSESARLLERLRSKLNQLDEWVRATNEGQHARCDPELLNSMYRSVHSLNGLSAIVDLPDVNRLAQEVENVLNAARQDELPIDGVVERLVRTVDQLSALVQGLQDPPSETSASAVEPRFEDFVGISDETGIPAKYLSIFIDETSLSLDTLTETLLNLEASGGRKAVEELLVTSHRIKGSAACVGLNRAAKLAHFMEDLVQRLRDQGGDLTPAMADAMLKCTDALRTYVDGLKSGSPDSCGFARAAADLLSAQAVQSAARADPLSPARSSVAPVPEERLPPVASSAVAPRGGARTEGLGGQLRARVLAQMTVRGSGVYGIVAFTQGSPLVGLKARLVHEKLAHLGDVFLCEPAAETLDEFEELERLVFGVATEVGVEVFQQQLSIAGVDRVDVAPLFDGPQTDETRPAAAERPQLAAAAPQSTASERRAAASAAPRPTESRSPVPQGAAPRDGAEAESATADAAKGPADQAGKPAETLRVDIERLDQLMNLAGQLVINKARFSRIENSLRQATAGKQANDSLAGALCLLNKISAWSDPSRVDRFTATDLEGIRTHARRVQEHLDCVRVTLDQFAAIRGCGNDLGEAVHQLDRIADGIQKSVMDTRMVPIGPLFGRFRRVIRDMARGNGRDIRLVIRGEKTELDKRMIDELGDPLIHMVRNSADHGIESPEIRLAAGKPREGTITLDAFQRGNSITIQVRDDGRGLDQDRIRSKAIEKGIVSPADAEKLTPHQIYQLVWEPGFSTAEKVTEISGRGMGMDIVKSKIEDINGVVELDSIPGEGTTLTIKLPLTLAILPSLMAQIGAEVFAFPVESVVEIVSVRSEDMSSVHGLPSAVVRGRVVSVARLSEIFTWATPSSQPEAKQNQEITLVIIGSEGSEMGLIVDRLLGEEDVVIKSMAENYQNVYGIAGASILGDGRVALILDTGVLIEMASKAIAAKQTLARSRA
jgi:two-component system, chemotaxis family, sensor kinase CheA